MEDTANHIGLTDKQIAAAGEVDKPLLAEGQAFVDQEKACTQTQALKSHWRAAMWSMFLSFALVAEGFDFVTLGSFWGQPAFIHRFGDLQPDGTYTVNANWQSAISNAMSAGQVIGLIITGYCQERFGSKKTYIGGMAAFTAAIFIPVFAPNIKVLLAGETILAIPLGMFQTLTTAYAAEICPIRLRGILASFVNMAWGIGIFLASGVVKASLSIEGDWSWRMPFILQWLWPVPLMLAAFFAPESPWWLVRKGRFEEAKGSLIRVAVPGYYDGKNLDAYIALMKHTDDVAKAETAKGSYIECFKGTNLRRTEIMFGVWLIQVWGGQGITSLAVQFFEAAGLGVDGSFDLSLALNSMFIVGTIFAWILLRYFGRRPLYLWGLALTFFSLLVIGVLACTKASNANHIVTGVLMIFINFVYNTSIGPLCYSISGELPSSRVRARSIVMGRAVYIICGIITGQIMPRMLNPDAWNLGAKSAFFWLATCFLCSIWCYFRLPETGGFSFSELDILFANKVATRKFTKVKIHDETVEDDLQTGAAVDEKKLEHSEEVHIEASHVLKD